ncbi:MAG: cell division protein FtsL [Treponema sp.]|nr:cell division protein FtsL [Treponema sp.]
MKKSYVLFFVMVFTIPVFLGISAWQANRCGALRSDIRRLERAQENLMEENKTVAAEIANLLAIDRLEYDAVNRLGMTRMRPEDVTLIIVGGD